MNYFRNFLKSKENDIPARAKGRAEGALGRDRLQFARASSQASQAELCARPRGDKLFKLIFEVFFSGFLKQYLDVILGWYTGNN